MIYVDNWHDVSVIASTMASVLWHHCQHEPCILFFHTMQACHKSFTSLCYELLSLYVLTGSLFLLMCIPLQIPYWHILPSFAKSTCFPWTHFSSHTGHSSCVIFTHLCTLWPFPFYTLSYSLTLISDSTFSLIETLS